MDSTLQPSMDGDPQGLCESWKCAAAGRQPALPTAFVFAAGTGPAMDDGKPNLGSKAGDLFTAEQWRRLGRHFGLTARQRNMAALLCGGHTKARIAVWSGLSVDTVRSHTKAIFEKLGVSSRAAMIVRLVLAEREMNGGP